MILNISPERLKFLLVLMVAIIFTLVMVIGIIKGKNRARSSANLNRSLILLDGLKQFYSDQGRYPSELEYQDGKNLSIYLKNFPGPEFTNKKLCPQKSRYISNGGDTFNFTFCLPVSVNDWKAGTYTFNELSTLQNLK